MARGHLSDAGSQAAMGENTGGVKEALLGRNTAKMLWNAPKGFSLPVGLCRFLIRQNSITWWLYSEMQS